MKKKGKEETINDRVKIVRKALEMTQQEFADKIKFKTGNTLSMIERGENVVNNQHILLICTPNQLKENKTVNENWLRTGQGDMFITPASADGLPILLDDNGKELPADERELIGIYRELMPENKKNLRDHAKAVITAQRNTVKYLTGESANEKEKGELKKSG